MERLDGTRYAYTKTRVAFLVPFIFLVPAIGVALVIVMLSTRALLSDGFFVGLSLGTKILAVVLALFGIYISRDLWKTFLRFTSEEIWITDRDIVWVGRGRKILVRAPHFEIEAVNRVGTDPEKTYLYEIVTARGKIRFTRSLEHADELIGRIQTYLSRKRKGYFPSAGGSDIVEEEGERLEQL